MSEFASNLFGEKCEKPAAAAIGAFDGLHLGHRHILRDTADFARINGMESIAVLFDPLPSQFFGRMGTGERILLPNEQTAILADLGIGRTVILPFSKKLADLTPESFLRSMKQTLNCEKLFMGEDFSIGKDRTGTPDVITEIGKSLGFTTAVIRKDIMDGDVISSTRIRCLLKSGQIEDADRLLGYPFFFSSRIIHGAARGRRLGFPTLNTQIPEGKIKLPNGVYAVNVIIDGKKYPSVTNIGVRPTFGLDNMGIFVESHLLDTSGDFYGKTAKLDFIRMLRKEIRFNSAEELHEQIASDILQAKEILL